MSIDRIAIAVFSSREDTATLLRTLGTLLDAERRSTSMTVDILINGNASLAHSITNQLSHVRTQNATVRVWNITEPDKAHAWNLYIYQIFPGGDLTFFVDGYASLEPKAIVRMMDAYDLHPEALAISGVQLYGPSGRRLVARQLKSGGLCGNLYALPQRTVDRLKAAQFRLPRSLYRNDSTLGAALLLDLDPSKKNWSKHRVVTVPDATFLYRMPSIWRPDDWKAYLRRRFRQAQGTLEVRAVRDHLAIRRRRLSDLPETTYQLIIDWRTSHRLEALRTFLRNPLTWFAYRRIVKDGPGQPRDYAEPELIGAISTDTNTPPSDG